jgi:hypothetical protein
LIKENCSPFPDVCSFFLFFLDFLPFFFSFIFFRVFCDKLFHAKPLIDKSMEWKFYLWIHWNFPNFPSKFPSFKIFQASPNSP